MPEGGFDRGGFVQCQPVDGAEGFEPGALGLGEFAGVDLNLLDGLIEGAAALQVGDDLGVSDGGGGLRAQGLGLGEQGFYFIEEARFDHAPDAEVDAAAFDFLFAAKADDGPFGGRRRFPLILKGADGPAGELEDFEGADDAFLVVGVDASGGLGIGLGEAAMEGGQTNGGDLGPETLANGGVGAGAFEEAVEQGLDIHGGAADGDDGFAATLNIGGGLMGEVEELIDAEGLRGLDDVDQMAGDLPSLLERRLGGADVHAAVNLHGIDADDLAGEGTGQLEGEGSLARGGDAEDQDFGWAIDDGRGAVGQHSFAHQKSSIKDKKHISRREYGYHISPNIIGHFFCFSFGKTGIIALFQWKSNGEPDL